MLKYIFLCAGILFQRVQINGQEYETDSLKIESLILKARELQHINPDSSLYLLRIAKIICFQNKFFKQEVECINTLAVIYIAQNKIDSAIAQYEQSIQLSKDKSLIPEQGLSNMYLGNLFQYLGNYSKAAEHYLQSAELLKVGEEKRKVIGLYRNIISVISNLRQQNLSMNYILPVIDSRNTDETSLVMLLTQKNTGTILFDFPDQTVVQEIDKGRAYVILGGAKFPINSFVELGKYTTIYRSIQKIPAGSLANIPDIPQDGTLIMDDERKVFLIKEGLKHWVQTPEVLEHFGGFDAVCVSPASTLKQIPDASDTVTLTNVNTRFRFKVDYQFLTDSLKTVLQKNKDLTEAVGSQLKEKNNSIQRQKALLWATLVGLVGVIVGLVLMYINYGHRKKLHQQSITALKAEEKLNNYLAIEKERTRIATDMHDDLGAGLSTLRFLSEKVKRNSFSEITKDDIRKMQNTSSELMEKMNEIIWAMNEKNDTLEDLLFYSRNYAVKYCEENNLTCTVSLPDPIQKMPVSSELRRNVFLIFKESLHNIVKHSGAKKVTITIQTEINLEVTIEDNGKGILDAQNIISGNGLLNMQKRIISMNGNFRYFNSHGFTILFSVPLE